VHGAWPGRRGLFFLAGGVGSRLRLVIVDAAEVGSSRIDQAGLLCDSSHFYLFAQRLNILLFVLVFDAGQERRRRSQGGPPDQAHPVAEPFGEAPRGGVVDPAERACALESGISTKREASPGSDAQEEPVVRRSSVTRAIPCVDCWRVRRRGRRDDPQTDTAHALPASPKRFALADLPRSPRPISHPARPKIPPPRCRTGTSSDLGAVAQKQKGPTRSQGRGE